MAELGDLARFTHPRQLMAYLTLIPSEDSSGERRHQGAITKAGNSSARRALVEAAHAYQYRAAVTPVIARRQGGIPKAVTDIAWKAQLRLCARFRQLRARGVNRNKIVVAVARELAGFVWVIAQQVKPKCCTWHTAHRTQLDPLASAACVSMVGCGKTSHPTMGQRIAPAPRLKGAALAGLRPPLTRGPGAL